MKIRIKSDQLVRYLAMGWKLCEMTYEGDNCWLTMAGSVRERIMNDLAIQEDELFNRKTIPSTRITRRQLCCWYGIERYGLTQTKVAHLFGIDRGTAGVAHKRVEELIRYFGLNLPEAAMALKKKPGKKMAAKGAGAAS